MQSVDLDSLPGDTRLSYPVTLAEANEIDLASVGAWVLEAVPDED